MSETACGVQDLDPFRGRQASDVLGRFQRERKRHQRQADLMWLGTMVAMFSDHELGILGDLGFLSQHDRDLIAQAQRHTGATPAGKIITHAADVDLPGLRLGG